MPKFDSFEEIAQQVIAYFGNEETVQTAYDLLTEAAPHFPDQAALIYNWRYCAAARMNQTDLALQLLQEALDAGFWLSAAYLTSDVDLTSLQELPEFKRLVEISENKFQAAQANSKPTALFLPCPPTTGQPLPLLLCLHGNASNAEESARHWQSAVTLGWYTVLLQSSQVFAANAYVWNDLELGAREIKAHYQDLIASTTIEPGLTVVPGHSKGGEMAIWLALNEIIPLAGFIAVNPGGPYIEDISKLLPLLENCKSLSQLRAWLVAGENDRNFLKFKALHEMFRSHGLNCELIIAPETAHDFPEDFDQTLAQALQASMCPLNRGNSTFPGAPGVFAADE
jgi:predicted esterase